MDERRVLLLVEVDNGGGKGVGIYQENFVRGSLDMYYCGYAAGTKQFGEHLIGYGVCDDIGT